MRIAYSSAQKREAVALARITGAEAAAASLGIDPRTVRKWAAQAGDAPGLEGNAAAWQRAFDLAHAKVEGILASGKASAVTAATIMGIAQRNLRDIERGRQPDPSESSIAAKEQFYDWLGDTLLTDDMDEPALEATVAAIRALPRWLLRQANAESDDNEHPSPHREALLAWYSGRPEAEAGDVLDWSKQRVLEAIEQHGSLVAWHAFQQAEDAADEERERAAHAAIREKAEALKAESRQAALDAETRGILAAAEAFLAGGGDG
jgi:hypothetical protein